MRIPRFTGCKQTSPITKSPGAFISFETRILSGIKADSLTNDGQKKKEKEIKKEAVNSKILNKQTEKKNG